MSFNGLLNSICSIQIKTKTQDTAGQMVETWATVYSNIKCRLDTASGGVKSIPQIIYEKATHILFMNIIKGFSFDTGKYRVVIGNKNYEVILVANAGGNFSHWQIALTIIG